MRISVVSLFVFVILLCPPSLALDAEPIGWAAIAGGTTGGQGGQIVTVTSKAEFISAVSGDTPSYRPGSRHNSRGLQYSQCRVQQDYRGHRV